MTLNMKTANHSFCTTLRFMMRNHHTKYGYKKGLSGSEHIVKLTEMLNLRCDFDFKHINIFAVHSSLWW